MSYRSARSLRAAAPGAAGAVCEGGAAVDADCRLSLLPPGDEVGLCGFLPFGASTQFSLPLRHAVLTQAEKRRLEKERNRWMAEQLRRQRELEAKEKAAVSDGGCVYWTVLVAGASLRLMRRRR